MRKPLRAGRPVTLAIDVGGSHIKAARLGPRCGLLSERVRIDTPARLTPPRLLETLVSLARSFDGYDRVSVGVNGLVHRGRIYAIPMTANPAFRGFDLAGRLGRRLRRPVRLLNDGQMHALGFVRGRGVEVVITLGTGLGSAVFIDGRLGPHVQLLASPGREGTMGGDYGELLRRLTNFDHLYIGGGNAERLQLRLPRDVTIGDNSAALAGGVRLWLWDVS